jgi:hypothetical protein
MAQKRERPFQENNFPNNVKYNFISKSDGLFPHWMIMMSDKNNINIGG